VNTTEEGEGGRYAQLAIAVVVIGVLVVRFGVASVLTVAFLIVALIVMIFLHELGHYLTAKAAGMKVTEFFIGFGPRIWSFQRGETEYGVKAIPAGAYVKIIGMNNLDEVDPAEEERTYRAKSTWRRLSVAVAGSTMHFLLAFVVICSVFIGFGTQHRNSDQWSIYSVSGPAHKAGLQPGDRVISLNGKHYDTYDHLADAIKASPGESVAIVVDRDGQRKKFTVTLANHRPTEKAHKGYLGISAQYAFVPEKPLAGIARGAGEMVRVGRESVIGLGRLFSPHGMTKYVDTVATPDHGQKAGQPTDRPTSVVGIVQVGQQLAQDGIVNVLYLFFAVNIFIGIFNLTPVLPFDGGHVAIAVYEKIRSLISGRRYQADVAKMLPVVYAVVVVLVLLFVTTIYMDIVNPVKIG
jgi:membrane-associated protease RseP (regulator of RpoE activity)